MDIYSVSESYAYPEGWLESSRVYVPDKSKSEEELNKELREYIKGQRWVQDYISYYRNLAAECIGILSRRLEIFHAPASEEKEQVNLKMLEMYEDDLERLRIVAKAETLETMKSAVSPRWKNF